MTTSTSQAISTWSTPLLHTIAELRELHTRAQADLNENALGDFARLFEGADRLAQMLGDTAQELNNHDLMNVLAAIRGYAEMLREDIGAEQPALDEVLSRLLQAVNKANDQETEETAEAKPENRVIQSEPGFILAVDDLQENRELVARYLSRSGHMVVTADSVILDRCDHWFNLAREVIAACVPDARIVDLSGES